jgi:hypothetical protein
MEAANVNLEKQLRQLAMLGITDFESTKDVRCLQMDMLRRLERSKIDLGQYASLTYCQSNHCAYKKCLEACWFGTRHRRLEEIPDIYHLLQYSKKPLYKVRFVRGYVGATGETSPLRSHYRCKEVEQPGA